MDKKTILVSSLLDDRLEVDSLCLKIIDDPGSKLFSPSHLVSKGLAFIGATDEVHVRKGYQHTGERTRAQLNKIVETSVLYYTKLSQPSYAGVTEMEYKGLRAALIGDSSNKSENFQCGFRELLLSGYLIYRAAEVLGVPVTRDGVTPEGGYEWALNDIETAMFDNLDITDNQDIYRFMQTMDLSLDPDMLIPDKDRRETWADVFVKVNTAAEATGINSQMRTNAVWRVILQIRLKQMNALFPNQPLYFSRPVDWLFLPTKSKEPHLWYDHHLKNKFEEAELVDKMQVMRNCGWERVSAADDEPGKPDLMSAVKALDTAKVEEILERAFMPHESLTNKNTFIQYPHYPHLAIPADKLVGMHVSVHPIMPRNERMQIDLYHNVDTIPSLFYPQEIDKLVAPEDARMGVKGFRAAQKMDLDNVIVLFANPYARGGRVVATILELIGLMPQQNFLFVNFRHDIPIEEANQQLQFSTAFDFLSQDDARKSKGKCPRCVILYAPGLEEYKKI